MKYLKYFESIEDRFYSKEYGISPDELKYYFTDLSDNGWVINIGFHKKLHKLDIHEPMISDDIQGQYSSGKLGLIPYIEVTITKDWPRFDVSIWQATNYLNELINSEEYLEIMEVVSLRLSDENLFIQKQYIENKQIHILIYRKTDENYVK